MIWINSLTFLITFQLINIAQWGKFFSHLWFSVEHKNVFELIWGSYLQITSHYSTCNTFLIESFSWILLLCSLNQSATTLMFQARPILCFWGDFLSFVLALVFVVFWGFGFFLFSNVVSTLLKVLGFSLTAFPSWIKVRMDFMKF